MAHDLEQLNDLVWLAHGSGKGARGAEIVFVHGLQDGHSEFAFLETWLSADGLDLWPKSWLSFSEFFDTAAVYLVNYDACIRKDAMSGRLDMYETAESLLANLPLAGIGQNPRNPIVCVGQDVGGLVIKEVCHHASAAMSNTEELAFKEQNRSFLTQLKGIFYFSTPHSGIDHEGHHWDDEYQGELMKKLRVFSKDTARSREEFRKLRDKFQWKAFGLGASYSLQLNKRRVMHSFMCTTPFEELCERTLPRR